MNMLSRLFILALWIHNLIKLRIRASALQRPENARLSTALQNGMSSWTMATR